MAACTSRPSVPMDHVSTVQVKQAQEDLPRKWIALVDWGHPIIIFDHEHCPIALPANGTLHLAAEVSALTLLQCDATSSHQPIQVTVHQPQGHHDMCVDNPGT